MRFRIPREYFLVLRTSSALYPLLGGLGASIGSGVVDGATLAIALASGVDASAEGFKGGGCRKGERRSSGVFHGGRRGGSRWR